MGCNSDHLEPRTHERESKLAAELIVYIDSIMGFPNADFPNREAAEWIYEAADYVYGAESKINELTVMLCHRCRTMTEDEQNEIIYNGRDKNARKLADWWDKHQAADKKRIDAETKAEKNAKLKKEALSKLNDAEKEALDLD